MSSIRIHRLGLLAACLILACLCGCQRFRPSPPPSGQTVDPKVLAWGKVLQGETIGKLQTDDAVDPSNNGFVLMSEVLFSKDRNAIQPYIGLARVSQAYEDKGRDAALEILSSSEAEVQAFLNVLPTIEAASTREKFMWPSDWEKGLDAKLPNLIALRGIGASLAALGLHYDVQDQTEEALNSFLLDLRLAKKISENRTLHALALASSIVASVQKPLTSLLMSGKLTVSQQDRALEALKELVFSSEALVAARDGEFALTLQSLDRLKSGKPVDGLNLGEAEVKRLLPTIGREKAAYIAVYKKQRQDFIGLQVSVDFERELVKYPEVEIVRFWLDSSRDIHRWRLLLTRIEALKVSAALAAFRTETGSFRERLAELQPKYFAEIPTDYLSKDGKFHYRSEENSFELFSVSPDLLDLGEEEQISHH